jgi:hypothetical protein
MGGRGSAMRFFEPRGPGPAVHYAPGADPVRALGPFAAAYRRAGSLLTRAALSGDLRQASDPLPALYLYTHALELQLKDCIYEAATYARLLDLSGVHTRLHNTHSPVILAEILDRSLAILAPKDTWVEELRSRLKATANDLVAVNPRHVAYRYPIDTNGQASASDHAVDITRFAEHLEQLLNDLETLSFGMSAEAELHRDMIHEYLLGVFA